MNQFLSTERLTLRPLEIEDTELFWKWFSDRETVKYSLTQFQLPFSKTKTTEWLDGNPQSP